MIPPPLLSGIVADVLDNFFPPCPYLPAGRVVVTELVLWTRLVFEGTFFVSVGQRGKRTGAKTLLLQCQPVTVSVVVLNHGDLRHPVIQEPLIHDGQIGVSAGLLTAGVRKKDQVDRDASAVQPDQ